MNEQVVLTLLRITKSTARPKKMKKKRRTWHYAH